MSQNPPSSPDPGADDDREGTPQHRGESGGSAGAGNGNDLPDFGAMIREMLSDTDNPMMAQAMQAMGVNQMDPTMMASLAGQLRAMFEAAPTDGLDLSLSTDVARKLVAAQGDGVVAEPRRRALTDAVRVAQLWLDPVTELSPGPGEPAAWSRAEWVEKTMPVWGSLVGPVAQGVNEAVVSAMRGQLERLGDGPVEMPPGMPGLPPGMDLRAMFGQFEPMLLRMSSSMFGAQIGQAVGSLAAEVAGGTEVGLPLVPGGGVALLPANVDAFGDGLEIDNAQVELYLAAREAARARLFTGAPWLGPQLLGAVQAYARDIDIDTEGLESRLAGIDVTDPGAVQEALGEGLFMPTPSPSQQAALTRLETLLALVEGWVDVVAERATAPHLPAAAALGEAVRRRRATGGPAEHLFGRLVGLELRPRRLRDAANLFAALENAGGAAARDHAWAHPDLAPTAEDLDDVLGYVEKVTSDTTTQESADFDAALADLLGRADGSAAGDGSPGPGGAGGAGGAGGDDAPGGTGEDGRPGPR